MTQYQYREKTHRQEASEKAIELWEQYSSLYRTFPKRYMMLLEAKKKLGISGRVKLLSKKTLDDYPDVPFFRINSRKAAADYIDLLSKVELDNLLHSLKSCIEHRSYIAIKKSVYDLDYLVRQAIRKKKSRLSK